MIEKLLRKSARGMTLLELSAAIVVMSIIGIGMTSGAQAVLLHYQADTVRQDLRQYGNNIMREIVRELNKAQKVEIDNHNGFGRMKLYQYYTDLSPGLTISCNTRSRILFNSDTPVNGVLEFPSEGVFRGPNTRTVSVRDFVIEYDNQPAGSSTFKNSYLELTLVLLMESEIMDEVLQPIEEEHVYHRTAFLGTSYIQTKITNAMGVNSEM